MSLIEQVEFPGPTSTMFELHPPAEALAEWKRPGVIVKWTRAEDPSEPAMAGEAPHFLFGRLPVEDLPPIKEPLLSCPKCAWTAICLLAAVACMVMLPSWPWTLWTFITGWLLALACVLSLLLWKNRTAVDSSELAS